MGEGEIKTVDDKAFVKDFEQRVAATVKEHDLVGKDDKVMVAVSGGKDSTVVLYILHKMGYNVEGMIIDQLLGEYSKKNLDNIRDFCKELGVKLNVVQMRDEYGCSVCYMKSVLDERGYVLNTCAICGVIRRSVLNKRVREVGFTKIVTGHNLDDEVQTVFMNYVKGEIERCARLGPNAGVIENEKFIPRVKPLYMCLEKEVERYSRIHEFPVVYDPCPCSADSFRSEIKSILNKLEEDDPEVKRKIITNFLKIRARLAKNIEGAEILECAVCGEPASNKVCRVCDIIDKLKPVEEE